jgi:hypothetical protein
LSNTIVAGSGLAKQKCDFWDSLPSEGSYTP